MKYFRSLLSRIRGRRQPADPIEERLATLAVAQKGIRGNAISGRTIHSNGITFNFGLDLGAIDALIADAEEELKDFRRNLGQL